MLHTLAREIQEETGLRVERFVGKVHGLGLTNAITDESKRTDDGFEHVATHKGRKWCKMCFVVEVAPGSSTVVKGDEAAEMEITIDALEHQAYGWFQREDVRYLDIMTERHRQVILLGFEMYAGK